MVIDFPSFPLDGELHTVNGIVYRYSSTIGAWLINADGVTNTLLVANTLTVNTSVIVGSINVEPTIIGAYDQANTARNHANTAYAQANAAFDAANNAVTDFSPAFNQANTAYAQANTVYDNANATFVKLTSSSQTITGDIDIVGTLTLSGNTVFIDATRLQIDDPLIYLAGNNYTSDIVDIGFIANYVNATGQNVHTGLYREHENKEYYLFQGYDKEPINNHIGALSNNMTLAVLNADIKTSNLVLGGANAILTIDSAFTKANNALANTSDISFNGNLNFPTGNVAISSKLNVGGETQLLSNLNFNTANSIKFSVTSANQLSIFTTQNERVRIQNNGWIGFGGPFEYGISYNAEVASNTSGGDTAFGLTNYSSSSSESSGSSILFNHPNKSNTPFAQITLTGKNDWIFHNQGDYGSNIANLRFQLNYTDYMILTSSGRLGLGTLNPTTNLHVVGTANVSSTLQTASLGVGTAASGTTGEIRATNNITAYYSDKRLKTDIQIIKNALDKVNQISGVTFKSNEEAAKYGYISKKTQVGVIAQEIEVVLPEVVVPAPFDIDKNEDGVEYSKSGQNYKTVQYEKLVPLLIESIKEISSKVTDLELQIKDLKDR